ncbi:MAG TPA: 2-C-methyl-D-erythritol 4-phosphate cytidylyltransferase [Phycisphaerales bacterium]|nr:2-C-methyl-D-erythritol 4-phosphate cytidylyltransferase [Phycisphaerales bacterium]
MKIAVIIPAAGTSSRYAAAGGSLHKLDEDLGGRPVFQRTLELFTLRSDVEQIIVAGPHDQTSFDDFKLRHGDKIAFFGATLVRGGPDHRWQSVKAALDAVSDSITHIAIHDAARPAATKRLIDRVFEAAERFDAVIPALEITDTIKRTEPRPDAVEADPLDAILGEQGKANSEFHQVTETLDRTGLVAVQTPQVFERTLLTRAYAQKDLACTDDASLVERLGEPVMVVRGDPTNIKLTRPADLTLIRAAMGIRPDAARESHKKF